MAKKKGVKQPALSADLEQGNVELDALAEHWDESQAETKSSKEAVFAKMRRLKKKHYKHGRINVTLTETESVRIHVDKEPPVKD